MATVSRIIHQIRFDGRTGEYKNKWKELNPSCDYWFHDLQTIKTLAWRISEDVHKAFEKMNEKERLSMARYIVLYWYGGAYVSNNLIPQRSIEGLMNALNQTSRDMLLIRDERVHEGFMVARERSPLLLNFIKEIVHNIKALNPIHSPRYIQYFVERNFYDNHILYHDADPFYPNKKKIKMESPFTLDIVKKKEQTMNIWIIFVIILIIFIIVVGLMMNTKYIK